MIELLALSVAAFTGAWDDDVMDIFLNYLLNGNTHIRADLLKTIIFSKNVQYVDKVRTSHMLYTYRQTLH